MTSATGPSQLHTNARACHAADRNPHKLQRTPITDYDMVKTKAFIITLSKQKQDADQENGKIQLYAFHLIYRLPVVGAVVCRDSGNHVWNRGIAWLLASLAAHGTRTRIIRKAYYLNPGKE